MINNLTLKTKGTPQKKDQDENKEKSTPSTKKDSSKGNKFQVEKSTFIQYKRGLIEKDYDIGEIIGSGGFATVRKVTSKTNGQVRALKIIKKKDKKDNGRLHLEVDILKKLIHINIMQIFEFYEDNKNFYIITEFCEGGELFDKIVETGLLSEKDAAGIMKQLLSAVFYIHTNNIVHRDLKPENILLDTKKGNIIKIIDWGTARNFDSSKKMNHINGTPYYIAPEVLAEKYDEKCDVWSCGVIMYILLCGYPPFNGKNDNEILSKIKKGTFSYPKEEWESVSLQAKELIDQLLEFDPEKRLSAGDALNHPWFAANNSSQVDKKVSVRCLKNMKKFHADRKLQQASLTYIVNNLLTKEEKSDLVSLFQQFDTNGDGVLTREEILNGYKSFMPFDDAEKEVDKIMDEIDIDKNGTIDYNEFVLASINKQNLLNKEKLETTFKLFDQDGNGSISALEIKNVLGKAIDMQTLDTIIKEVDMNGDGEISLVEYKEMMLKLLDPK